MKNWKHCFDISRCIGQNSYLTIHPADAYGLKYGYEQQTHPAGSIRIKQLEDVHPSLTRQDKCQFPVKVPTCQTQLNKIKYKVNDECMIMVNSKTSVANKINLQTSHTGIFIRICPKIKSFYTTINILYFTLALKILQFVVGIFGEYFKRATDGQ